MAGESLADTYIRNYPDLPPELVRAVVYGMTFGVRDARNRGDDDETIRKRAMGTMHDEAGRMLAHGWQFDRAQMLLLAEVVMENALGGGTRP